MNIISCLFLSLAIFSAAARELKPLQADPCQEQSRMVSDVTYCDRYWECIDGVAQQFDCPNGLVFAGRARGLIENCDYPWRSNSCEDKQLSNTPVSVGPCDWKYGIFRHQISCIRYWTCWNSTATEQFCIGGLLYDEEKHACDWPEAVEGCQKHPPIDYPR